MKYHESWEESEEDSGRIGNLSDVPDNVVRLNETGTVADSGDDDKKGKVDKTGSNPSESIR